MAKRRKKKKAGAGLVILVIVLVLAALFLGYMVLSQMGMFPSLPSISFGKKDSEVVEELSGDATMWVEESSEEKTPEEEPEEKPEEEPSEELSEEESLEEESSEETEEISENSEEESSEEESSEESSEESEESSEDSYVPYYYYTDIVPNILSSIEMGRISDLADYVGSEGLRLCPTGILAGTDVTLSRDDVRNFMDLPTMNYGVSATSGKTLVLTPAEYLTSYISPVNMDFAAAKTLTDDEEDLSLVTDIPSARTVSFYDTPSVIEWHKVILVFSDDNTPTGGYVLRAIIYKDMTTY